MAGHIIAVVGGKGGVGKSVFSANLALAFLKEFGMRSLLVDQDMSACGDQNLILGIKQGRSLVEAVNHVGNYDTNAMQKLVTQHASGLHVISAPKTVSEVRKVSPDALGKFYKGVRNIYPIIIVDCGSKLDTHTIKAMEFCTGIFVVTIPDILVVHQTMRMVQEINENMFPQELIQVVVNRFSGTAAVNPATIQRNLGRPILGAIPDDPQANNAALSQGNPVLVSVPNAASTRGYHELVRKIQQQNLLTKLAQVKKPNRVGKKAAADAAGDPDVGDVPEQRSSFRGGGSDPLDARSALKLRVHKELVERVDFKKEGTSEAEKARLREKCKTSVVDILNGEDTSSIAKGREEMQKLVKEILDEALGLGALEDLLADKQVNEIMVISRDRIYCERAGKNFLSKTTFSSDQQLMNVIERIVMPLGRRIDEKSPYVDARLPDGSRVHAIIPPLAIKGPTLTIRKFPSERLTWKHLVNFGSMTTEIADFLRVCVEARLNIIVAGGTGSGKTTLLNVLSNFIPSGERIITVEDAAELDLGQDHVVRLETRPANIEGEGEVSIRELVKQTLRMKPDRVIVGECRAGEALDMLQAMNTGHDGSLTTVHANTPRDSIARLETLVMMAGMGLPVKAIREQIAGAVHLIVQQSRLSDGSRKITYITECVGMQGDTVALQDVFIYKQSGLDKRRKIIGKFVPTGFIPKFVEEMEAKGMKIPRSLFSNTPGEGRGPDRPGAKPGARPGMRPGGKPPGSKPGGGNDGGSGAPPSKAGGM